MPARRARPRRREGYGRKILILVLVVAAAVVTVAAITGERGWMDVRRQRAALSRMRAEVASIERENATLLAEVRSLRTDPFVIERLAREHLGYARPGEIIFQFPADTPAVRPAPPPRAEPPRR